MLYIVIIVKKVSKTYLKMSQYLLILLLLIYIPVLERFKSCSWDSPFTLFLWGLYSGGLIFEGKFVLVIRRGLYSGSLYSRSYNIWFQITSRTSLNTFTVTKTQKSSFLLFLEISLSWQYYLSAYLRRICKIKIIIIK